jgi:hypothetical protein
MVLAHYLLDTQGYQHTIYNTYCFPTATMVAQTRPIVTLYGTLPVVLASDFDPLCTLIICWLFD